MSCSRLVCDNSPGKRPVGSNMRGTVYSDRQAAMQAVTSLIIGLQSRLSTEAVSLDKINIVAAENAGKSGQLQPTYAVFLC